MQNNDEMMNKNDIIKQELLEILNEISCKFSKVLQKHGIAENQIITVEFKFFDKAQLQFNDASPKDFKTLLAPIAPNFMQIGSTWCPEDLCPPDGKWLA